MSTRVLDKAQNEYPVQELVTFSKIKNQKNPEVRIQMTTAMIVSLRGHHAIAYDMFQSAIQLAKG